MKKHFVIFVIIFLVTIGYATLTTTLDINGNITMSENIDDFKIEITNLVINNENKKILIDNNKKSFTFIGTGADVINYTVTNYSYQYDADIVLSCTHNDVDIEQIGYLPAQERLTKNVISARSDEVTCTINVEKISRIDYAESLCKYTPGDEWLFDYTGDEQDFIVPCDGEYKIELYGAQGGNYSSSGGSFKGGKGSYTSGSINLLSKEKLYINVGGQGQNTAGGYNGGGNGGSYTTTNGLWTYPGGGGSTDIRYALNYDSISHSDKINSRIMVAAGGGGASYYSNGSPGDINIIISNYFSGASSSKGGGGGGGYFGGSAGQTDYGGNGGTSYISGYYKTMSISNNSKELSDTYNHYSGKKFFYSEIQDDIKTGNGMAKITYIGEINDKDKFFGTWEYRSNNSYYVFEVLKDGYYQVDLIGAQGGNHSSSGGSFKGGYGASTSGILEMKKGEKYLLYVGSSGAISSGGYNGGGNGGTYPASGGGYWTYAGGGGSTDIRYFGGSEVNLNNNDTSLRSRIMVAAGGGGASYFSNGTDAMLKFTTDTFYFGANSSKGGGGGGGYFGGSAGQTDYGGNGGTSYISGYYKTVAVNSDSNTLSDTTNHFSGKIFENIKYEVSTITGNGNAKITYLGDSFSKEEIVTYEYDFNNSYYVFSPKEDGLYKIDLFGAQGGNYSSSGGSFKGGYGASTSGILEMKKGEKYLLYVGSSGAISSGGYNGGGNGGTYPASGGGYWTYAGGGGSTDIRYFKTNFTTSRTDAFSLRSRIMVASGGGGASYYSNGGSGDINKSTDTFYLGAVSSTGGGGGSGYFGGSAGRTDYGGTGGSSYISGYENTLSVLEDSNDLSSSSVHFSGKAFTDMTAASGVRLGNGYAKITYIRQ